MRSVRTELTGASMLKNEQQTFNKNVMFLKKMKFRS